MPSNRVKKYVLALEMAAQKCKTEKEFREITRVFAKHLRNRGEHKILNRIWQEFKLRWRQGAGRELLVFGREPLAGKDLSTIAKLAKKAGASEIRQKTEAEIGAGLALLLGSDFFVDSTTSGKIRRLKQLTTDT